MELRSQRTACLAEIDDRLVERKLIGYFNMNYSLKLNKSKWKEINIFLATDRPFTEEFALKTCLLIGGIYFGFAYLPWIFEWITSPKFNWHLHIGGDFISFYSASELILSGHPLDVYDVEKHSAAQARYLDTAKLYFAFYYPPLYMMLCYPLALFSYFTALALWLASSMAACLGVLRRWAPDNVGYLYLAAFPAVEMTISHGQNAFLTTMLLGGGFLVLDRRPILAGVLFGVLAFKPHLGVLVPLALIVSGRWRTIVAAAGTVVVFGLASVAAFGSDIWRAYALITPKAAFSLEQNLIGNEKMQSVFAMLRILGSSVTTAYAAQAFVAICVAVVVAIVAWRVRSPHALGAVVVTGAMLTTPFLLRYDLMLLAIPLLWFCREAKRTGIRSAEAKIAIAAFLLPAVPLDVAQYAHILLAPLVIAALFIVMARRALDPSLARLNSTHDPFAGNDTIPA